VSAIELDDHPADESAETPRRTASRGWRALRYATVTGAIGASAVVGAAEAGGVHWSLRAISWVVFGFFFGAVFGPLFALARDDGADEVIRHDGVVVHGRSDSSIDGAQARDLRRAPGPDPSDG
jgi:hypothetical protein